MISGGSGFYLNLLFWLLGLMEPVAVLVFALLSFCVVNLRCLKLSHGERPAGPVINGQIRSVSVLVGLYVRRSWYSSGAENSFLLCSLFLLDTLVLVAAVYFLLFMLVLSNYAQVKYTFLYPFVFVLN
jgi:hypothetical protein